MDSSCRIPSNNIIKERLQYTVRADTHDFTCKEVDFFRLYTATVLSFVLAFFHFILEVVVFETASFTVGVILPIFISGEKRTLFSLFIHVHIFRSISNLDVSGAASNCQKQAETSIEVLDNSHSSKRIFLVAEFFYERKRRESIRSVHLLRTRDAMAADYSDTLFVTGEGAPMKFYIAPGKEKQELKPLIEVNYKRSPLKKTRDLPFIERRRRCDG